MFSEGEERKKGIEAICEKILAEKFSKQMKSNKIQRSGASVSSKSDQISLLRETTEKWRTSKKHWFLR